MIVTRRKPELQALDLASWPSVAWVQLDRKVQELIKVRIEAIERYARGETIKDIEKETGANRRQLYRWLARGLSSHPDGRLYGFRAVISHVRVKEYARTSPLDIRPEANGRGTAGALSQPLERYPTLAAWLTLQVKQRRVTLEQVHTEGRLRTRLRGLQALHVQFLWQCRSVGITAADYPLNTDGRGIRSISRRLKEELLHSFQTAARAAGAPRMKGLPNYSDITAPSATRAFQVVEFDGHRVDLHLKVAVRDIQGFDQEFAIERVWLLAIIDVCTRAVLGYRIALGREYSRLDVVKTIENALRPHSPRGFTIPHLSYGPNDGFPSQRLPELAYVTWEWMKLDNAKANLANDTLNALCEFVGCCADAGPRYSPDERPYIERFFGTIASRLSSRLPGYTGSHPHDVRRALSDPKGGLRLCVTLDELEDLIEYAIAAYNGTPHAGLNNATPLEAMESCIRGRQQLVTRLPENRRSTLCLMQSARRCFVRAHLQQGVRPHINLYGARYTSRMLACSTHLIGKPLLVYINADDLRSVQAFLPDGSELGILEAQGAWRSTPHGLQLRQQIEKEKKNRKCKRSVLEPDPIGEYVRGKLARARRSRKAASELAEAMRTVSSVPSAQTPSEPTALPANGALSASPGKIPTCNGEDGLRAEVVPQKLSIGSGQVF